jgi:hypothetical protein
VGNFLAIVAVWAGGLFAVSIAIPTSGFGVATLAFVVGGAIAGTVVVYWFLRAVPLSAKN